MAPVMPRPLIVVPWAAAACCELWADAIAAVAISIFFWVARWFSHARVTSSIEAAIAKIPIQKWSMKETIRKTGVQGRSKMAAIAGLLIAVPPSQPRSAS